MIGIVDRRNAAYFDNRLSPAALVALHGLNEASGDAQALADRTFRLMRVARFDAMDLSVHTARIMGAASRSVPSAPGTTDTDGYHGQKGIQRGVCATSTAVPSAA
jgi:hypothetical protein